jgi:hypothetical protein
MVSIILKIIVLSPPLASLPGKASAQRRLVTGPLCRDTEKQDRKTEPGRAPGFVALQGSHVFLKEIFKLLFGKHGINHFKDHRLIIRVKFLDLRLHV